MRIAVAQTNCVLGDLQKNIDRHIKFCNEAIKNKADMIVFPELSLTGYALKDLNYVISLNPYKCKELDELKIMSKKISIVAGFVEEDEAFGIYNSAVYFEDGEVKFTHKKVYQPTYGLFEQRRYFIHGIICKSQ